MLKKKRSGLPELLIRATDINPDYIGKARAGVYRRSSLKGLSDEVKSVYFHACENLENYCMADYLKKYITWEVHDMLKEPPPEGRFQIIFLKKQPVHLLPRRNASLPSSRIFWIALMTVDFSSSEAARGCLFKHIPFYHLKTLRISFKRYRRAR